MKMLVVTISAKVAYKLSIRISMIGNPGFIYTTIEDVIEMRSLRNIKITMGLNL